MKKFRFTLLAFILAPILLYVCIEILAGGEGYIHPLIALFPWAMAALAWEYEINAFVIITACIQLPIYGLIIDRCRNKKKTLIRMLIIHVIAVVLTFKYM